jgi:hypothetical protein
MLSVLLPNVRKQSGPGPLSFEGGKPLTSCFISSQAYRRFEWVFDYLFPYAKLQNWHAPSRSLGSVLQKLQLATISTSTVLKSHRKWCRPARCNFLPRHHIRKPPSQAATDRIWYSTELSLSRTILMNSRIITWVQVRRLKIACCLKSTKGR